MDGTRAVYNNNNLEEADRMGLLTEQNLASNAVYYEANDCIDNEGPSRPSFFLMFFVAIKGFFSTLFARLFNRGENNGSSLDRVVFEAQNTGPVKPRQVEDLNNDDCFSIDMD